MPEIIKPDVDLPEKCWEILPGEPLSAYKQFQDYISLGSKRTIKAYIALRNNDAKGNGNQSRLSKKWYWTYRASMYDMSLTQRAIEKNAEEEIAKRTDWNKSFEIVRKKVHTYLSEPDNDPLHGIQKVAFALKGNTGNFLIGAHKALFGEKHEIEATIGPKITLDLEKL